MNAYCPSCETELDQATGICPACRWDPFVLAAQAEVKPVVRQRSLTEQYRGTEYDLHAEYAQYMLSGDEGISRGRMFVLVGLAAAAGVSGIALGALGVF